MSIEREPLKLMPHTARLLQDGALFISLSSGRSFEIPKHFRQFFDLAKQGFTLAQIAESLLIQAGASSRGFKTLGQFVVFLGDHDLLADRRHIELADSLREETTWHASIANSEIFSEELLSLGKTMGSTQLSIVVSCVATALSVAGVVTLFRYALIDVSARPSTALIAFVLAFLIGRSLRSLLQFAATHVSEDRPGKLSFCFDLCGPFIDESSRSTSLGLPSVVMRASILFASAAVSLFAASLNPPFARALAIFAGLLILVDLSPFAKSRTTIFLRDLFAYFRKHDESRAPARVRLAHVSASVLWVIWAGAFLVLGYLPFIFSMVSLRADFRGSDWVSLLALMLWQGVIWVGLASDLFNAAKYDDGAADANRYWREKKKPSYKDGQLDRKDLEQLPFIRQIGVEAREQLLSKAKTRLLEAGEACCRQNSKDRALFIVLSGRLAVARTTTGQIGSRRRKVVAFLEAGAVFGEAAFFFGKPRMADVVALEPAKVLVIEFDETMKTVDASKSAELQARIWFIQSIVSSGMFKELPAEAVDALAMAGEKKIFAPGQKVIQEGEAGDACYFVVQGQASVTQNSKLINKIKAGDAFGEIALLNQGVLRTATIIADSELITIRIDAARFRSLITGHLPLAIEIERLSRRRLAADLARAQSA